jgi:hypothetical protein
MVRLSSKHGICQQINLRHVLEEKGSNELHMYNVMVSDLMTGIVIFNNKCPNLIQINFKQQE